MAGFIKLDRSIFEHWIFQDAEKFRAFVDLIQLARWKDAKLLIGNDLVTIPRGSYYTSVLKLAERWRWGRDKTRNFLTLLEKERMITIKATTKGTMLTIENYRVYQDEHPTVYPTKTQRTNNEPDNKNPTNQQRTDNEPDTKEEREEYKEIKEYKEREEGKEEIPVLTPLSYPTPTHKIICEQFGEVAYRTWFFETIITENEEDILITSNEDFRNQIIKNKYADIISNLTGKLIKVGGIND